jgi:hypothetical protein
MGWDWFQYRQQPQWFITNLMFMLQNEAEEAKRRAKA